MSYLEFCMGDISPQGFTVGWAFHCLFKPRFSWFAQVIMWVWAVARMSCLGLVLVTVFLLIGNYDETDCYQVSVARGSEVKKARCKKFVVFMCWQRTLKLCFMHFLPVADPEILPHIWKIALQGFPYLGDSPTSKKFAPSSHLEKFPQ